MATTTTDLIQGARDLAHTASQGFDVGEDGTSPGEAAWLAEVETWAALTGDKFAACRHVIARFNADAGLYRAEAARLTAAADRAAKVAERVEQRVEALLRERLALTGEAKVSTSDGGWCKLASRKSVSVEVEDVDALDPAYVRVVKSADKALIGQELKAGRPVAGAVLVERSSESVAWSR